MMTTGFLKSGLCMQDKHAECKHVHRQQLEANREAMYGCVEQQTQVLLVHIENKAVLHARTTYTILQVIFMLYVC